MPAVASPGGRDELPWASDLRWTPLTGEDLETPESAPFGSGRAVVKAVLVKFSSFSFWGCEAGAPFRLFWEFLAILALNGWFEEWPEKFWLKLE